MSNPTDNTYKNIMASLNKMTHVLELMAKRLNNLNARIEALESKKPLQSESNNGNDYQ